MIAFEFATATEIVFGAGRSAELGVRARALGGRALLVTGSDPGRFPRLRAALDAAGLRITEFVVHGEPTTSVARRGVELCREARVDVVLGLGGGSVLDAAKAVAGLAGNGGEPFDYLEVVGRGQKLERPSLPFIAVPTTSGTGSEVTKNAVLEAEGHGVKVSLRSAFLLPRLALVDPELSHGVPPDVTAATGLDALTQVIEPYVSNARGPLTDALCLEGMRRGARSLARAVKNGDDAAARADLAVTSLFGGLALANAKLGAVHGFAGPLGGSYAAPHGALCARLLPEVMAANLRAIRALGDRAGDLAIRYAAVARALTDRSDASADEGVEFARELVESLKIPRLASYGVRREDFPRLVEKARVASSMKGNAVALGDAELTGILDSAL